MVRFIDMYVGIPLCFITSMWLSFWKFLGFYRKHGKTQPKNILFISLAEMGIIVLSKPAIEKAKRLFPNSKLFFLVFKGNEHGLKALGLNNIFSINPKNPFSFILSTLNFLVSARIKNIDTVINLEPFVRFNTLLGFWCGAKNKVGFHPYNLKGLYIGNFQTHKIQYTEHTHISKSYMAMIMSLKSSLNDIPLLKKNVKDQDYSLQTIKSNKKDKKHIYSKLKNINNKINPNSKIIIINPNPSMQMSLRNWTLKNYCELTNKILKNNNNLFVVIIGLANEKQAAIKIQDYIKDSRCIDFTGQTTNMAELIHLFNISNVFVSCDCGPAHFASLTNIKSLIFFGPGTPELYGQLGKNLKTFCLGYACSPCLTGYNQRLSQCKNNLCIKNIKVEDVYKEVIKSLK